MTDIIKLTVALVVISIVAGLAIGFANTKTRDTIAEQQRQSEQKALMAVFPEGAEVTENQGDGNLPEEYWSATVNDETVGYAFKVSSRGYSGDIVFMAGTDTAGTIVGLSILEQSETPGLGTRVQEISLKRYIWKDLFAPKESAKPWFTEQFEGLRLLEPIGIEKQYGEWHKIDLGTRKNLEEQNKVTAITGSTISTKAVVRGLEEQVSAYVKALKESQ